MASSRSPAHQMPFGYSFDIMPHFPFPSPPAPAPGPSLLDDAESSLLGDFFDHVSSTSFDNTAYILERTLSSQGESGTNFGWPTDFPPPIPREGHSLSVQPAPSADAVESVAQEKRPLPFLVDQTADTVTASEDVLMAASTLLRNGQTQISGLPTEASDGHLLFRRQFPRDYGRLPTADSPSDGSAGPGYLDSRSRIPKSSVQQPSSGAALHDGGDVYFNRMMFGLPGNPSSASLGRNIPPAKTIEVRWGSDASFLDHGYVAPPDQETEEEVTKGLLKKMEFMVAQSSITKTRPSSPDPARVPAVRNERATEETRGPHDVAEESPVRPQKRRRTQSKEEEQPPPGDNPSAGTAAAAGAAVRTRKTKGKGSAKDSRKHSPEASSPGVSSSKGPKGMGESHKATRENLTEEQKRSNHILSEQKRRNLIKQGFDDLCSLVPDLRGGGYSKSAILIQAADWLEDLLRGNDELKAMLASLQARGRSGP